MKTYCSSTLWYASVEMLYIDSYRIVLYIVTLFCVLHVSPVVNIITILGATLYLSWLTQPTVSCRHN